MTASGPESEFVRRLRMILRELDQLPTLGSIAVRLIDVTASDRTHAREVIQLVSADPALSSKVLQLCRRASRGVNIKDGGIDRAVIMLGFEEVRNLALAVEVFELMDGMMSRGGEPHGDHAFGRELFWRHCVAVAVTAEALVRATPLRRRIGTGEAFVAGLLHDLGQLALHSVLPATLDRICNLAETRGMTIDDVALKSIGMSTHTVGKHVAEHWGLPSMLVDAIWLCEQPRESLPAGPSRELAQVVTLADAIARQQMICHHGHGPTGAPPRQLAEELSVKQGVLDRVIETLHEDVANRCEALGLGEPTPAELVRDTLDRANEFACTASNERSRMAASMRTRSRILNALELFASYTEPADSSAQVIESLLESAALLMGDSHAAVLVFDLESRVLDVHSCDEHGHHAPAFSLTLRDDESPPERIGENDTPFSLPGAISQQIADADGAEILRWVRKASALAVLAGDEQHVLLVRPSFQEEDLKSSHAEILVHVWRMALAACALRERGDRLTERLVESNRMLVASQEETAQRRAMAAIGELAAGAAHEMNNPLTVISGRSQLLARKLADDPDLGGSVREITEQCAHLSDLITALSVYAESPKQRPQTVCVSSVVKRAVQKLQDQNEGEIQIKIELEENLPCARFDPDQVQQVLREVLQNAQESAPGKLITVRVQIDPLDDRLMVVVIDCGGGMSEHSLRHAFDPFFSEKPAGRQPGLGLARARRLAELNHAVISLKNGPDGGTMATILFSNWRVPVQVEAA